MRAIKFRAWHKTAKKMVVIDALLWSTDGYLAHTSDGLSGSGHLADIVLMQYTGVDDKNGTPIYEHDVVRYYDSYQKEERWVVIWNEDNRSYDFPRNLAAWPGWLPIEIIGNIHEQPELKPKRGALLEP